MAKRKITVTIDDHVVETLARLGGDNLSATVNDALIVIADRLSRSEALGDLLNKLDATHGEPSNEMKAWATAAIDELDGVSSPRVEPYVVR